MNNAQLTLLGGKFNEKARPFEPGDVIVKHNGSRWAVTAVDTDTYADPALICVSLVTGAEAILFEREIAYRSV